MEKEDITKKIINTNIKVKTWFHCFINFVNALDIDKDLKTVILEKLYSDENIENSLNTIHSSLVNTNKIIGKNEFPEIESFFRYLNILKDKYSIKYFEKGLKYALDFETIPLTEGINKESNTRSEIQNIIDRFIKFIVVTNFNDIEIKDESTLDLSYGRISIYLGGIRLAFIEELAHDINEIKFNNFRTRIGLKGIGLGSKLMCIFIEKVRALYTDYSIAGASVKKNNISGSAFYKKFGFEAYDFETKSLVQFEDLVDENSDGVYKVLITADRIIEVYTKNNSKEVPFLVIDGERIDCYTDFSVKKFN